MSFTHGIVNARQVWETSETISGMRKLEELYARHEYLDAYAAHTDARVKADPHSAVGGMWEEIGILQFEILVRHGLDPKHTLLDIGCGTLRGGRHFIRFLDVGNYTGIDISRAALEYAHLLVENEGLSGKKPRLMLNWEKSLHFSDLSKERFDFLLAQSVFTHLPREEIQKCFIGVRKIMHSESLFFFTFRARDRATRVGLKSFQYPFEFFENLASQHNFRLDDLSNDYPHPRRQAMALLRLGV